MDEWVVRAANSTTYTPFGSFYEGQCIENVANPWKFTGQWHDEEIDQYHLRARQYDPAMMRFISRDSAAGRFTEPATLHKYLYCWNNPLNLVDFNGEHPVFAGAFVGGVVGLVQGVMAWTTYMMDLEMSGVKVSEEDQRLAFYSLIAVHTVGGAVQGGILAGTGRIDAVMGAGHFINQVAFGILEGVVLGEVLKAHKGGGLQGQKDGIIAASNARQVGILMFIDQNF